LEKKVILNYRLLDWLVSCIKDVIEESVYETPERISTFIAVNNMLNELDKGTNCGDIGTVVSEDLLNKIFFEIKDNI